MLGTAAAAAKGMAGGASEGQNNVANTSYLFCVGEVPSFADEMACNKKDLDECLNSLPSAIAAPAAAADATADATANCEPFCATTTRYNNETLDDTWAQKCAWEAEYGCSGCDECVDNSSAVSFARVKHASHSDSLQSVYDQCKPGDSYSGNIAGNWRLNINMLLRGMYSPQIRGWFDKKDSSLSRSQIMVVDFDSVVKEPRDTLERIGSFYGLGKVSIDELPEGNSASDGWGADFSPVETIDCETKDMMTDFYKEWNAQLVTDLQGAYNAKEAPPEEPYFEGFGESSIECE